MFSPPPSRNGWSSGPNVCPDSLSRSKPTKSFSVVLSSGSPPFHAPLPFFGSFPPPAVKTPVLFPPCSESFVPQVVIFIRTFSIGGLSSFKIAVSPRIPGSWYARESGIPKTLPVLGLDFAPKTRPLLPPLPTFSFHRAAVPCRRQAKSPPILIPSWTWFFFLLPDRTDSLSAPKYVRSVCHTPPVFFSQAFTKNFFCPSVRCHLL